MNTAFAHRLKTARTMAGLSQAALCGRLGSVVSRYALAQWENGVRMANEHELLLLAKALQVKPDYLLRPLQVQIANISFRKKSSVSVRMKESLLAQISSAVERYIEVEELLGLPSDFLHPLPNWPIRECAAVEDFAVELQKVWQLGNNPLPNVLELLESKGIKVVEITADASFDGLSGWANAHIPFVVLNKQYAPERKRLTALHELGHLLLDFPSSFDHQKIERACFRFAAAMLVSKNVCFNELGKHRHSIAMRELVAVKELYGISVQALMHRAKDLSVISEAEYIRFRQRIANNRTEEGLGQYIGQEQSSRFDRLVFRAASEEIISMSKAANLRNQKLAVFKKELGYL